MQLGIVGLVGSGKSTLFKLVSGAGDQGYQVGVNRAQIPVPDPRLEWLSHHYQPKKTTAATVELLDIPGLGGEKQRAVLAEARTVAALVHVVRAFESSAYPHPKGSVNVLRDLQDLESELALADLEVIERRLERLKGAIKKARGKEAREEAEKEDALLRRIQEHLETHHSLQEVELTPEEEFRIRGYAFLSRKPQLIVVNKGEEQLHDMVLKPEQAGPHRVVGCCLKLEAELLELEEEDRALFMEELGFTDFTRDTLVRAAYQTLDLATFFTVGDDEVKAWTVPAGENVVEAAGTIHTDLARGFIRAEVFTYDDLVQAGDEKGVKAAGKFRLEGKTYQVQDGDILCIRFSV